MSEATTAPAATEAALRAALAPLERPFLREWSVKSIGGELRAGRYLVSLPRRALGPGPSRVLRGICASLGAPASGIAVLDRHQAAAVSVHFGYEPEPAGAVLKCYLEFPAEARPAPDLSFLALKWRGDGAHAVSRYLARDRLDAAAQRGLVDALVPPGPVRAAMGALMALSAGQTGPRLLEIDEPGSPRRSVDLNLTSCGETVGEQADLIAVLLGNNAQARDYSEARAGERLGHVAAGTARDGRPFATLYHGAHRVLGEL